MRTREGKTRDLPVPVVVSGRAVPADFMQAPEALRLRPEAEEGYVEMAPQLSEAGLLDRIDTSLLAVAAGCWGDIVIAQRVLDHKGYYAHGSKGQIVAHAAVKQKRDAVAGWLGACDRLPLSPVARARLGLAIAAIGRQSLQREMAAALDGDDDVVDAEVEDADVVEFSEQELAEARERIAARGSA